MNSREEAERLYLENEKLIYGALQQYFPALAFDEDIQQIAGLGLWKACLHYDAAKSRFSTAAYKFIANEVLMELRKRCRMSEVSTISLNTLLHGSEIDGMGELDIMGILPCADDIDWCDIEAFWELLTERQRFIVKARISGLIDEEIAAALDLSRTMIIHEKKNIRRKAEETL